MKRREFITALAAATALPLAARAQRSGPMRRIGVLIATPENDPEEQLWVSGFMEVLKKHGWIAGTNIQVEHRWGAGDPVRTKTQAAELAGLKPDVILAQGTPVAMALIASTRAIPIVFVNIADPISTGLVKSLAKPGGNLTGFTNFEYSMGGKWLELLKEISPTLKRVLVILNPDSLATPPLIGSIENTAHIFNLEIVRAPVHNAVEIENEVAKYKDEKNIGLMALPDFIPLANRDLIVELAARYKMPSIFPFRVFATAGGLMALSVDNLDAFRRAASYVDLILRGAKPDDLPVQAPTTFQLTINIKTAKAIGLTVPEAFLLRANEVLE